MEEYEEKYYEYQTQARGLLNEESLKYRFEKLSKWYRSRLGEYLPNQKNSCCLDIPCGYGNFLYHLEREGYTNIVGYDLDNRQVKLAKLLGLNAEVADIFEVLESNSKKYDFISSMDFIEHLSKNDALKFIELMFKSLNLGGKVILRTPCADSPFGINDIHNDLTHRWGVTSNVMKTMLEMNGFTDIHVLDERPQPTNLLEFFRWLVFFPAKILANLGCMALGMRPPNIWSRSMIVFARKQK